MKLYKFVFVILCFWAGAFAQSKEIIVESVGFGVSQNDAITQAKREALAKGIGQMLTSQTEVENFMVKRDVILTETMGHVKNFKVLKESQGSDGAWEVHIKASVSEEGLAKDLAALKILMQTLGNPRIAFLVKETVMGNADPSAQNAEAMLLEFFKAKDFRVVDPNQALRFRESADGVKAVGGDPQAAAKLGDMLNAEVIVVGSAVAQENDVSSIKGLAGTGVKSASAVVSLKAFNVSTREILAAKSANGAMVNVSPIVAGNKAIEKAIHALLASQGGFFESIVENWRRSAADGQNFVVEVSGVDEFSQIRVLRDIIATKATKVEQRSYQKPLLIFEVTRPGTAEDLAGVLDALQIEGQKLSVEGLNGNIINISVTKASE